MLIIIFCDFLRNELSSNFRDRFNTFCHMFGVEKKDEV